MLPVVSFPIPLRWPGMIPVSWIFGGGLKSPIYVSVYLWIFHSQVSPCTPTFQTPVGARFQRMTICPACGLPTFLGFPSITRNCLQSSTEFRGSFLFFKTSQYPPSWTNDSPVLSEESGGYPLLHTELGGSGHSSSLRGQSDSSGAPVCSRPSEYPCRFPQLLLPDPRLRVDPLSSSVP